MASFKVYKDAENEERPVKKKLWKTSKVELNLRSVLGDIDTNKALRPKPQASKDLECEKPNCIAKDISEAIKEVNLESNEGKNLNISRFERENGNRPLKFASIKHGYDSEESSSDISLDISPSDIDPKYNLYVIKLYTDALYDCLHYREDIYTYLREIELKKKPKPFYMKKQPDITPSMRAILVDWLVDVAELYNIQDETLFMSVSYTDMFLSKMSVVRTKLQLLGTTTLFIASKYEEIFPLDVSSYTSITDDTYTKKQVLKMEQLILKTLDFDLSVPTYHAFVAYLTKVAELESKVSSLALYICELALTEGDPYLQFPSSLVASAAIALARHCFGHVDIWPQKLSSVSGYSFQNLCKVLKYLNYTHKKASSSSLLASKKKFGSAKRYSVSLLPHKHLTLRTI